MAGCLLCGKAHNCGHTSTDNDCNIIECDDGSKVCTITGYILPHIRYAKHEYLDHVLMDDPNEPTENHLDTDVSKYVDKILNSSLADKCRNTENNNQSKKLYRSFMKIIKLFKLKKPDELPNMCNLLTSVMSHERRLRFICKASVELRNKCVMNILVCLLDLKGKGFRISQGNKLQDLVCGLLYLLRTGISYKNLELLGAVPEIATCLPIESRLKLYFNINSKAITSVENEVKLSFRDYHQKY